MYRLTDRRKAKALPILQKYKTKLDSSGSINEVGFEKELCECWNVGYREIKDLIEDLAKCKEYIYLAAYYMENSNAGAGVVTEFQSVLAKLYGIKWYSHNAETLAARKSFWAKHKKTKH
jgi:hypothetical protein